MGFQLHPQLEKDTSFIGDLPHCRLLLMNNARYNWLILVPRIENAIEWHDLEKEIANEVFAETMKISRFLQSNFPCDKVNIGALGNMVPQLHIHIIARIKDDFAWPAPVWGRGDAVKYQSLDEITEAIKNKLSIFLQNN